MSDKDLNYYLAHPDEMPEDPKEIERLTRNHMQAAEEGGQEQLTVDRFVEKDDKADSSTAGKEDAPKAEDKAKEEAAAVAAEADEVAAEAKAGEQKPDGVLAKDGKHVIPYSQLESARARATAAETLANEQAAEIERLKAEKTPAANAEQPDMLTEDELAALEADSPTLAKTLRAQQAAYSKLAEQVEKLAANQQTQVDKQETEVKSEIQTAIDANPVLAGWQTAEDQTIWAEASRFDKALRESPKYKDVPFAERFAKVVELTQSALGLEAPKPAEQVVLTPEQIKAAAAAKLKEKEKSSVPLTLSSIPGGAPPAVDERDKVEQMPIHALGQQFLGMSKEQMEAYLTSL